jgi:hypothetical protein
MRKRNPRPLCPHELYWQCRIQGAVAYRAGRLSTRARTAAIGSSQAVPGGMGGGLLRKRRV